MHRTTSLFFALLLVGLFTTLQPTAANAGFFENLTSLFGVEKVTTAWNNVFGGAPAGSQTAQVIASDPDLVAAYNFDTGSGSTLVDQAGNNDGTISGATWSSGSTNTGLDFDGSNDYVDLDTLDIGGNALTITAWINADSYPGDARIISKASGVQEQDHYWMLSERTNNLRLRLKTNGTTHTLMGSQTLPTNTWVHVAAVYNGSTMTLYQDGTAVGSSAKTGTIDTGNTVPVSLARSPEGSNYFDGTVDDVRIYDRALTQNEVASIAGASVPPAAPTVSLSASPTTIQPGDSSTLTWSSTNADSCTGTNFNTSSQTSGSVSVSPSSNTTYTIACMGVGGSDTDSIDVTVAPLSQQGCTGSGTSWFCSEGSTLSDVQAAYSNASKNAVITVAPGNYTWSGSFDFDLDKGVSIIGAGKDVSVVQASGLGFNMFGPRDTEVTASNLYRISGFTFNSPPGRWLEIYGTSNGKLIVEKLRVDNNKFTNIGSDIFFMGTPDSDWSTVIYGVIDNNEFSHPTDNVRVVRGYSIEEHEWSDTTHLGTGANLFIEDNVFDFPNETNHGAGCIDSNGGLLMVVRYNTFTNCRVIAHGIYNAWFWGTQNLEVYGNHIASLVGNYTSAYRAIHHQGAGTMIVFDNTVDSATSKSSNAIEVQNYRSEGNGGAIGNCDGTESMDGNRPGQAGYPCFHQPGRIHTGELYPIYVWNNRWDDNGAKIDAALRGGTHVINDRDVYNEAGVGPQTSPTSPFDGSSGMGYGAFAYRPTTCTPTQDPLDAGQGGVGYFATDVGSQGTLYHCSDTNTWSVYYTPYTYPHPLRNEGTTPSPTATLSALPTSITSGQSSTLTWSSTNADSCTGTGFSTGGATSGSVSVSPTTDTAYSINCDGVTDSATVTVTSIPSCTSFTYSSWNTCEPSNTQTRTVLTSLPSGCTGTPVTTQSCTYIPPTSPACSDGIDNDADSFIDYPNDPGCANTSDDDESNATSNAYSAGERVEVTVSGTLNVRDTANGTQVGTQTDGIQGTVVSGPGYANFLWWWQIDFDSGTDGWVAEDYLQSTGAPTPPTVTLTASDTTLTSGDSTTLNWSSTQTTTCLGTNFTPTGTSGTLTISPTQTTTYTVACTGPGGVDTSSVTVTIQAASSGGGGGGGGGSSNDDDDEDTPTSTDTPTPENRTRNVPTTQTLTWPSDPNATEYIVYLSEDSLINSSDEVATTPTPSYTPSLDPATKYYWRVDTVTGTKVERGTRQYFTTAKTATTGGTPTTPDTPWIHGITHTRGGSVLPTATRNQYAKPYFTYQGVNAMLMKVYQSSNLIILRAGSGSKLQKIAPTAQLYKDGQWHTITWSSVWPKGSDGMLVGKGYYILRNSDPLYDTVGAYRTTMQMYLPGCDNATCNVNGPVLQEWESE